MTIVIVLVVALVATELLIRWRDRRRLARARDRLKDLAGRKRVGL